MEFKKQLAVKRRDQGIRRVCRSGAKGHPVVFGQMDEGAEKTLLIYGMYDVMPTDEEGWTVDPWAAEMKELLQFGPCIINVEL